VKAHHQRGVWGRRCARRARLPCRRPLQHHEQGPGESAARRRSCGSCLLWLAGPLWGLPGPAAWSSAGRCGEVVEVAAPEVPAVQTGLLCLQAESADWDLLALRQQTGYRGPAAVLVECPKSPEGGAARLGSPRRLAGDHSGKCLAWCRAALKADGPPVVWVSKDAGRTGRGRSARRDD